MTSSKSSRASIMPSSLSLSSFRTSSPLHSSNADHKPPATLTKRAHTRRKSGVELPPGPSPQQTSTPPPAQPRQALKKGEPVPPRPLEKTKSWSNRLTALLPSLIINETDSISRKPISSLPPPPASAPPPPPYKLHDSKGAMPGDVENVPPPLPDRPQKLPVSASTPSLQMDAIRSAPAVPNPQIMSPIPPSPEMKRATLTKQAPPPKVPSQSSPQQAAGAPQPDEAPKANKLQKDSSENRPRHNSLQQPGPNANFPNLHPLSGTGNEARGRRSVSAQHPGGSAQSGPLGNTTRVSTLPTLLPSAAASPHERTGSSQSPSRGRLRRSWLPGGRSRSNSTDMSQQGAKPYAWVISEGAQAEYNPAFLRNGDKVPELWNESANVFVYLYPRTSGCGPSFKVMDFTISSSYILTEFITQMSPLGEASGELHLFLPTAPPSSSGQLSVPSESSDIETDRLIAIRNLFAFLTGQALVATKPRPTMFHIFLQIASLLEEFGFVGEDGTSFGHAVNMSFDYYAEQLKLADCRNSREKTLEALILGERMRSMDLYTEAFAHAAGKYSAILDLQHSLFERVSPRTRQQLEKSHLDLVQRQHNVNEYIEQFEFPSLFAGIANSTSMAELRQVRFGVWRKSFNKMRSFVLNHYKSTFGNWPPKASSSKNPFAESGLNRIVLKMLYGDMCSLYDLLVDRTNRTSRVIDEAPALSSDPDKMINSALRNMMSEYDRSRPPVLPPIPYDVPQLPSMTSIFEAYNSLSTKDQLKFDKKVKEHEIILILNKAYNWDTNSVKTPFLASFKDFELREAKGKTAADLADQRIGYWLFLYVVIQSLPMLVVDAPGLKFTEGTEYFLCEPPMGNPPWMEDRKVRKMWYEVAGSGGIVELSTDAVLFSVEAIYNRSHCWLAAKIWEGAPGVEGLSLEDPSFPALEPPPAVIPGESIVASPPLTGAGTPTPPPGSGSPATTLRSSTLSPGGHRASHAYRSSIALGLEPVPMGPPAGFGNSHNRSSSHGPVPINGGHGLRNSRSVGNLAGINPDRRGSDPPQQPDDGANTGATFDDILGDAEKKPSKKKGFFF